MISVTRARQLLLQAVHPLQEGIDLPVQEALGFVLAENVFSPLDLPPFNQSNVDGYAVSLLGAVEDGWKVLSETKAGDSASGRLNAGEAIRIFTGAMVPEGADAIIMQEFIRISDNKIELLPGYEVKTGEHIRLQASQLKKETMAMEQGKVLNPAGIGFLQMMGIARVKVYRKPRVHLVLTGNELQQAGTSLHPGMVYESNGAMLDAALQQAGIKNTQIHAVKDDRTLLLQTLKNSISSADVLLISGGISVGDYDFVYDVLKELGVTELFYKVAQRPGKPLYAGQRNDTLVFGLPGNPSSALCCFYEYVYPALRKLTSQSTVYLPQVKRKISADFSKKAGLQHFVRAHCDEHSVTPLPAQDSFMLQSFVEANCFMVVPEETTLIRDGEEVVVHLIS